jgi:hypothetical protein
MLKNVHKHIINELHQSSRTDTVFIVSAVLYNLVVLGISWGVAAGGNPDNPHPPENDFILALLIIATVAINAFIIKALLSGKNMRIKLLNGLVNMYKDNEVDKYYDPELLQAYTTRYRLFSIIIMILAAVAIIIPLVARILG